MKINVLYPIRMIHIYIIFNAIKSFDKPLTRFCNAFQNLCLTKHNIQTCYFMIF